MDVVANETNLSQDSRCPGVINDPGGSRPEEGEVGDERGMTVLPVKNNVAIAVNETANRNGTR